jgi:Holliday junction resolvase-like predicted endonuclease
MSKKSDKKKAEKKLKKAAKKENKAKRHTSAVSEDVSPQQREEMIATAAYYIAQRHSFSPGETQADWEAAEKEIDELLGKAKKKKKKKE